MRFSSPIIIQGDIYFGSLPPELPTYLELLMLISIEEHHEIFVARSESLLFPRKYYFCYYYYYYCYYSYISFVGTLTCL